VSRVSIVTDSASDLTSAQVADAGVTVVPLLLSFGERQYRAGVDITTEEFWQQLTAAGAPFPKTAAAAPGTFHDIFEQLFAEGADEILYVGVGDRLSATLQSARVARDMMADRPIHLVDSASASMGQGLLTLLAAERAQAGVPGAEIAAELERRRDSLRMYVVLETLEYLKRGGRISGAQAAIGSVLSVKPIITIQHGVVETVDKPRTRGKARARLLELLSGAPAERVAVLHGQSHDIEEFAEELASRLGHEREGLSVHLVGSTVGPHVGPGAYGAVILPPA
jgi:DegV family protein with EDD domain